MLPIGYRPSEETKRKMSEAAKKRCNPPILNRKELARLCLVENKSDVQIGDILGVTFCVIRRLRRIYGIKPTLAQLAERNRMNNLGKKWTLEARLRKSQAMKGRKQPNWQPMSKEGRAKLGAAHAGPKSWNWNGGRTIISPGYIKILSHGHPNADRDSYVFEHRLIVEGLIGRYLGRREAVHHINKKESDNRPENLMAFTNHGVHLRFERNCSVAPEDIIFDGRVI